MFNEDKAWKLLYRGEIVGCVRVMKENAAHDKQPRLVLAIHLDKARRKEADFCTDMITLMQGVVFDQKWRSKYQVLYVYNFDYTTIAQLNAEAKDGKQWFGGTVLLDSSGVPLF